MGIVYIYTIIIIPVILYLYFNKQPKNILYYDVETRGYSLSRQESIN